MLDKKIVKVYNTYIRGDDMLTRQRTNIENTMGQPTYSRLIGRDPFRRLFLSGGRYGFTADIS